MAQFCPLMRRQLDAYEPVPIGPFVTQGRHRCIAASSRHSITSSARASSVTGIVMPSALAALRLITNLNFAHQDQHADANDRLWHFPAIHFGRAPRSERPVRVGPFLTLSGLYDLALRTL
jgi:hypothetical protein